ncbi:hypothetical protein H6784_03930 [Candidatus Nomurabacteria bacterium]|nr:hypothetical protein [Candidatus Kaiserbacteria bacterium]MCB9814539.1 hypothetical protein [Candidatus Nomurabacteria bacterium]
MHPFLQNRFVRFTGIGLLVLLVIFFVLIFLNSFFAVSTGLSNTTIDNYSYGLSAPMVSNGVGGGQMERSMVAADSEFYAPSPMPMPDVSFTPDLEKYETSRYDITARTKQFDELCSAVKNLKSSTDIHFKQINESLNNCQATFYVAESKTESVLSTFSAFRGVEVNRNTESVTRHRAQLQSQTDILRQQLSSVESSLSKVETQFDEIAEFSRTQKDASTLAQAIREKLNMVDSLTQRKINLTNQLNNLYQQSAELEERIDVVEFYVSVYRSYPIYLNKESQKWEKAWEGLKETYTDTLIGLTAFFGIFILWVLRIAVYLLVVIVVVRGIWKVVKLVWKV